MKLIDQRSFLGLAPRVAPHLLAANMAQVAIDVDLRRGRLDPLRSPVQVASTAKVGTIRSIYRFGKDIDTDDRHWFHFTAFASVCRASIAIDPQERTFYCEAGQPPRVTDATLATAGAAMPFAGYRLGVPGPVNAATGTVTGTPTAGTTTAQSLIVTYTFVNTYGDEGPPAPFAAAGDWKPGQSLTVSGMEAPPSGEYSWQTKRIYVSIDGGSPAFWTSVAPAVPSVTGGIDPETLIDSVPEPYLMPPPADLHSIDTHPGRFMVAASGKQFMRSEVNRPYGWPDEYKDPIPYDIVGLGVVASSTVILTRAGAYIAQGSDPLNQQIEEIPLSQSCLSRASIAVGDGAVWYAGSDGLARITASGVSEIVTASLLTSEQWKAYSPATMVGAYFDGKFIAFYTTGSTQGALIFDVTNATMTTSTVTATAAWVDPRYGELFISTGTGVQKWNAGSSRTLRYRTRRVLSDRPTTPMAARVVADAYPVTFRLYADNALRFTQTVTSDEPFGLPSGYRARTFEVEAEGSQGVSEILLCQTKGEVGR